MSSFAITTDFVDVSHGIGIPFGGIGTGYCVFGKYGFTKVNFDSTPDKESFEYPGYGPQKVWDYLAEPEKMPVWGFLLTENGKSLCLQEKPFFWYWQTPSQPVDKVRAYAYLPKGVFAFEKDDWNLGITMTAFSPMIPHDLESSTIPVQVFDFSIENKSRETRTLRLHLGHRDPLKNCDSKAVREDPHGQIAFACDGGTMEDNLPGKTIELKPGETHAVRFFLAWFFPKFKTSSVTACDIYRRYYAKRFSCAANVIDHAIESADRWSEAIDAWHDSLQVPAYFKRLWFSSLASVITSTMLSDDPYFFEIETPHRHVDTMDVNVYSSWLYMVNWPEIERLEMNQFVKAVPAEGPMRGFVWHSLWNDAADYAEEPTFLLRLYRDFLWFNDSAWLGAAFPVALRAANRVYQAGHAGYLIDSKEGNQSYDAWKMPGVSAYVNAAWVYGLYALDRMSASLHQPALVDGIPAAEFATRAAAEFDKMLWNKEQGYWNCFHRTPDASSVNVPEAAFTDQLFGRWAVLIDPGIGDLLLENKVRQAMESLYHHNLIEDRERNFRGWVNGLLPGRNSDIVHSQYIGKAFWICAQLDLGSLLGEAGNEEASLDVFRSLEASLHNNHLAVGEYNQCIDADLKTLTLPEEPGKDTPRFPPYPRYKCSWEYLIRILGLKMDEQYLYLQPFRAIDFAIRDVKLAGTQLTVNVQAQWTKAIINGAEANGPIRLDRAVDKYNVEFRR